MELRIRPIGELDEALALAPELDRYAAESLAEFRDTPSPADVTNKLLARHFDASPTLLLVAEDESGKRLGVCLTAPFEDPLTGETIPMIVILHVDPEMRRHGVARALVADAMRLLVSRGHSSLAARAGHNDDALISMGERWGFLRHWELMLHE